jgi:TonB family protein
MRSRLLSLALQLLAIVCFIALVENAAAQSSSSEAQETGVLLTKLFPPAYPPLSRGARITGDVKVRLGIRRDGSIASQEVISGHPMLNLAAMESAQKSVFECRRCSEEVTVYSLTYTFALRDHVDCSVRRLHSVKCLYLWRCGAWQNGEPRRPEVTQSQSHITILADPPCVETTYVSSAGG